ncbi:dTMP kinase [Candidatus Saccharibacteria bacterium]|nr:dTMP kinase [Candidatus Saccharibacteria bacterium]MBJ58716.1 dTMP kinase [Candidatus Saccharibacteria bacterium]MBQ69440.1 dTMP kinase [Candidatus Saccharibacteria bacterium]|tara:strand:+ start:4459 stop:5142 length:684 start_codon:yes stop_codon:yes gene_type:complete
MSERGKYVVVEGADGVGKSTVMNLLAQRAHRELGVNYITIEEPDGALDMDGNQLVPVSEKIRAVIKDGELARSALTNVLLFNASRRENLQQAIEPALARGDWSFAARNYYSTDVYQGKAEGWPIEDIERMVLEATSTSYMQPDYAFILDIPEEMRLERLAQRGGRTDLDTFEKRPTEFQIAVGNGYRWLAKEKGIPLIDATAPAEEVADHVWHRIMYGVTPSDKSLF